MRHTDSASSQQLVPRNLSTTTPLVISRSHNLVDLAEKANPCLRNEEHKQVHGEATKAQKAIDSTYD